MKTCPVCALDLEDDYLFCPDDGSNLVRMQAGPSEIELASTPEPANERASAVVLAVEHDSVVLYCPKCAAEYPLTFSDCPVHDIPLIKHRIPGLQNDSAEVSATDAVADREAVVVGLQQKRDQTSRPKRLTSIDLTRPSIERPISTAAALMPTAAENHPVEKRAEHHPVEKREDQRNLKDQRDQVLPFRPVGPFRPDLLTEGTADFEEVTPSETTPSVITPFGYWEPQSDVDDGGLERPGFRVAAITTIIVLVALSAVAAYKVISHLSRRAPATSATMASTEAAAQVLPFVPTPKEAQDFKEEAPVQKVSIETEPPPHTISTETKTPPQKISTEPPPPHAVERAAIPNRSSASPHEGRARPAESIRPVAKAPIAATPPMPATTRVSSPPMPALPRGNSSGFDARLIRVRSMKTPAGVRYDLTFNLQEQAGRAALWQRVLISTRSASGISRSQALPFSHRLGASGALTFTINVELTGRSEADWQGRVVCTALGWDNNGGPLQASFAANVAP